MFKRLLILLDGTPESAAALPLARTVARLSAAELPLVRRDQRVATDSHGVAATTTDDVVDDVSRESFPASDAPAWTGTALG